MTVPRKYAQAHGVPVPPRDPALAGMRWSNKHDRYVPEWTADHDGPVRVHEHDGYKCEVIGDEPRTKMERLDLLARGAGLLNREALHEAADDIDRNGVAYIVRGRGLPRLACRTIDQVIAALRG